MPATLLLLLAFSPLCWRLPQKRLYLLFFGTDALLAAIFAVCAQVIWLRSPGPEGGSPMFGNVYMLLSILVVAALYFRLNREPPTRKLYLFFMAVSFAAVQYSLVNASLLFSMPADTVRGQIYIPDGDLPSLAVEALILPPAAVSSNVLCAPI